MIAILMAAYNGEKYLEEQLDSIKRQTFQDWHLIISDDSSTDRTLEIARKFQKEVTQQVTILENQVPKGSAKNNFFHLLKNVEESYIMFADQDDVWKEDKIEKTLSCMKKLEKKVTGHVPILVHTDLTVVDENMGIIADSFFQYAKVKKKVDLATFIIQNNVTGCTIMMNRELYEGICQVKDLKKVIMHDYWAALYAMVYGVVGVVDQSTMYYRQHESNSVGAKASGNPIYLWKHFWNGYQEYQKSMKRSMEQIGYFCECYQNKVWNGEKRKLLSGYADLCHQSKAKRILFYTRYRVLKIGIIRRIMQYLWG